MLTCNLLSLYPLQMHQCLDRIPLPTVIHFPPPLFSLTAVLTCPVEMQAGAQVVEAEVKLLRAEGSRLKEETSRLREERQAREKELADARLELATIRRTFEVAAETFKSGILFCIF